MEHAPKFHGMGTSRILAVFFLFQFKPSSSSTVNKSPEDHWNHDHDSHQTPTRYYLDVRSDDMPPPHYQSSIKMVRVGSIPRSRKISRQEAKMLRKLFKLLATQANGGSQRNEAMFQGLSPSPLHNFLRGYFLDGLKKAAADDNNPFQIRNDKILRKFSYLTNRSPTGYDGPPSWFRFSPHDLANFNWNQDEPLKIIIHGFTPDKFQIEQPLQKIRDQGMFQMGDEYLKQNEYINVILLDWTSLSTTSIFNYAAAVNSVKDTAAELADFLFHFREYVPGVIFNSWGNVHLIGYSLGAHVAGAVGRLIVSRIGIQLGRITGIDPSGPGFVSFDGDGLCQLPLDLSNVLSPDDAVYVDVIHCNMGCHTNLGAGYYGEYGTTVVSGDVDFYPNGGKRQKGCTSWKDTIACSHDKCVTMFTQSISQKVLACPCQSWDLFRDGFCDCSVDSGGIYFGEHSIEPRRGTDGLLLKGRFYLYVD